MTEAVPTCMGTITLDAAGHTGPDPDAHLAFVTGLDGGPMCLQLRPGSPGGSAT